MNTGITSNSACACVQNIVCLALTESVSEQVAMI